MREVDDVEHAEDHGQPEAEQGVEHAVDQAEQKLAEQRLRVDAKDCTWVSHPAPRQGEGVQGP